MARDFNGSSDNLLVTSTPVTAVPISISAWVYADALTADHCIVSIRDNTGFNYFSLYSNSSGTIAAQTIGTTATTSSSIATGKWYHVAAVFSAVNSRAVYINGGSKGTGSGSSTPTGIDRISVGAGYVSFATKYWNGKIAEVGIWNKALSDADVLALSKRRSPDFVRPDDLPFYSKILGRNSPEPDLIGSRHLTVTGATQAAHPGIIYPWHDMTTATPAAVAQLLYLRTLMGVGL